MNNSLVEVIRSFAAAGETAFTATCYDVWNTRGASATRDTVTTLAQLYQRQLQEAQIPGTIVQEVVNYRCQDGIIYTGQMKNGKFHGTGILKVENRGRVSFPRRNESEVSIFQGHFFEGELEGHGTWTVANIIRYEGNWKKGKMHGHGKKLETDGMYVGEFCYGKREGFGKLFRNHGNIGDGQWKDKKQPEAEQRNTVNGFDEGKICEGALPEFGRNALVGLIYEGEWKDDKWHGNGKAAFPNGDMYEGEFTDGKQTGYGKYVWKDGTMYEGQWKDDKQHGNGKQVDLSGDVYEGEFTDGKQTGYGKYRWTNGDVYEGNWKDNNRSGAGTLTLPSGTRYVGIWEGLCTEPFPY